ncbi:MAG: PIN domain-containing protein [Burkholderiales bacterium]|nr:PIN domain-containing protein [Burkholderiales bacterium]
MATASTVFVDTNVLVYADDAREDDKRPIARAWLEKLWLERRGRTSQQVLNEYYAVATRKLAANVTRGDARAEVRRYQHWQPWAVDHQTVETAWALEARFGISWWDSLMVAAALHQGCEWLLTEDLQHDQRIDGLRIVNPFLVDPAVLDQPPPEPAAKP